MAKYKLDELCEFITDGTHQTPEYCEEGGVIFLSSKDVTERKINWDDVKYIPESLHQKLYKRLSPKLNDILLAKNGTTGVAAIVDRDEVFDVYVSLAVLRPLESVYPKYLLYAINSPVAKRQFNAGLKGIGVPNLHLGVIRETVVNVAPRDEQEKICEILDKVSSVIDSRKAELSALDDLIKARFVEMFGDPIINSKNKDTQDLKDVLVLKAGDFTAASDISEEPTETNIYPCYGGNGIRGYVADYNQEGEYSLVGRQGALSGNVQYAEGKFRNTEHALLVTPIIEMNSIWLNQLLINLDLKRYQTGAAQPGLSVKNLQEIPIIMVSIDEQNRYADFVKQVDKSKVTVQKALDETQLLFDSLMQKYFG